MNVLFRSHFLKTFMISLDKLTILVSIISLIMCVLLSFVIDRKKLILLQTGKYTVVLISTDKKTTGKLILGL